MYSMNYIGKFIANFREFYNEINGATLTGAIDVVVVEQPDGSFTCSPFHVRFGKLGVLRSRFKVVDLELNGEPLNIHMKLGESGEAFFVEEVGEDEAECSAHLATSPIPAARFEDLYEPRRRNSLSVVEPDHGQASDYTKRRYTADGQSMQKPDLSKITKKTTKEDDTNNDNDALFEMDGLDEATDKVDGRAPRTFAATQLGGTESEAHQVVQKISAHNDFRPIEAVPSNQDEVKPNGGNGKKKKKTRKASSKKHQRKSSTSSISSQSDRAGSEQRATQPAPIPNVTDINFFSDTEVTAATLSEEMSNLKLNGDNRIPLALSDTAFEGRVVALVEWTLGKLDGRRATSLAVVACGEAERVRPLSRPRHVVARASPRRRRAATDAAHEEASAANSVLSRICSFMSAQRCPPKASTSTIWTEARSTLISTSRSTTQTDIDLVRSFYVLNVFVCSGTTGSSHPTTGPTEEEYESGNGPSLPQSPASLEPPTLDSDDDEKLLAKGQVGVYVQEERVSRALSFEEFCEQGAALAAEGRLVVRLGGRAMPWRSAGPLLLSLLAYRRPLPNRVLEALEKNSEKDESQSRPSDSTAKPRGYSWWSWRRSTGDAKRTESSPPKDDLTKETVAQIEMVTETKTVTLIEPHEEKQNSVEEKAEEVRELDIVEELDSREFLPEEPQSPPQIIETPEQVERHDHSSSDSDQDGQVKRPNRRHSSFRKTLRLSSEQIKDLNLREGMNEMVFSVTTAYQGTTRCKCNVFRWRYDDKIVISDIDGTITKSDVLGHIFPLVGKDWAQSGVAQLFTKIKNNGYQLLYLSARAIGQARVTREYLRSIRQGEVCLPDGPLLLNPTSLLRAFHREVIEKKPEEFKIQCLADIKALFPAGSNPFYAGYGNRVNDVCAYQAVGIPIVRIFTINYKGELKHELTQTFQSTYSHMSVLVDQVFPPAQCEPSDEFSQTVFWREPLLEIELPPISPPLPKHH
ncbi:hypothetical protein SFRURICE_003650 [Spodoptera frugiperda]|nr:hypothetical protein SFRURICE_003650 [Spodoptera frugiperda]